MRCNEFTQNLKVTCQSVANGSFITNFRASSSQAEIILKTVAIAFAVGVIVGMIFTSAVAGIIVGAIVGFGAFAYQTRESSAPREKFRKAALQVVVQTKEKKAAQQDRSGHAQSPTVSPRNAV